MCSCVNVFLWKQSSYLLNMSNSLTCASYILQYSIAMMGYAEEHETTVLELTYNYGVTEYTKGNAYAQVSLVLFRSEIAFAFPVYPLHFFDF